MRDCALDSVVTLFTGPTVTDAARADLKREMEKGGVRKSIFNSVIQGLINGGAGGAPEHTSPGLSEANSENGDLPAKKEYIPPSLRLQQRQPTTSSMHTSLSRTFSGSTSLGDAMSRPESRATSEIPPTPADSNEVGSVYVSIPTFALPSSKCLPKVASSKDLESEFAQMLKHFEVSQFQLQQYFY